MAAIRIETAYDQRVFYQPLGETGLVEAQWADEDERPRREIMAPAEWGEFLRRASARGYAFVEVDFGDVDPQDRR